MDARKTLWGGLCLFVIAMTAASGSARADLIGADPEAEEAGIRPPPATAPAPIASMPDAASPVLREWFRDLGLSRTEIETRLAALSPAEREAVARDPRQVQVAGVAEWLIGLGISFAVMIFRWLFGF
ncbi:MAG: hypothetical protein HYY93_12765 [Planctomycetes bacterium]|nr:hypothetical protein [Planctomycetota bacterium]